MYLESHIMHYVCVVFWIFLVFSPHFASKSHPCFTHGVLHLLPLGVIFHYVSTSYSVYHFPVNGSFRRVQSLAPISSVAVSVPEWVSLCLGVTFCLEGVLHYWKPCVCIMRDLMDIRLGLPCEMFQLFSRAPSSTYFHTNNF